MKGGSLRKNFQKYAVKLNKNSEVCNKMKLETK